MSISPIPPGFEPLRERPGFDALIGPYYVRDEAGEYVTGVFTEPRHVNPRGVVHGGFLYSFADFTLGAIVYRHIERGPCATISLNADYLSGARPGEWLECHGAIVRETRSMMFMRAQVRRGDDVVMRASGIWKKLGRD